MRMHPTVLSRRLHSFLGESDVLQAARAAGFGQRNRKCTPVLFFWTLVLGINGQARRSLSSLRRFFISISGRTITSPAFQKRFTAEAAEMFRRVFERLLEKSLRHTSRALPPKLRRFRDLLSIDSTAFALHDKLARYFRGCCVAGSQAVARVSVVFGLSDHRLRSAQITPGRVSETRFFPVSSRLANHLLLFDLGYFSLQRFRALQAVGAHFVCRLWKGANPVILDVHQGASTRRKYVGRKLKSVSFRGPWVDLDVHLGKEHERVWLRLVGAWNEETRRYHYYLTTLPRETFGPGDISETYRLRWQVELLFKELKSVCRLTHIPTRRPTGVLCLIYASLIVHLLSRFLAWLLMRKRPWQYSPMKWTLFLLNFAWRIARDIVEQSDRKLQKTLEEVAFGARRECLRERGGSTRVYGVSRSGA